MTYALSPEWVRTVATAYVGVVAGLETCVAVPAGPPFGRAATSGAYAVPAAPVNYVSLLEDTAVPIVNNLPNMDADVQKQTCAVDFAPALPSGVVLTGTPTVTVTVAAGTDPTPQARVTSAGAVGTVPPAQGGTGTANTAVVWQMGDLVGGVTYLIVVSCGTTSTNADVVSAFTHLSAVTPG